MASMTRNSNQVNASQDAISVKRLIGSRSVTDTPAYTITSDSISAMMTTARGNTTLSGNGNGTPRTRG